MPFTRAVVEQEVEHWLDPHDFPEHRCITSPGSPLLHQIHIPDHVAHVE